MVPPIVFCEEYPSSTSLAPAKLIAAPTLVFLAARDFRTFDHWRAVLSETSAALEAGWWLYLPDSLAPSVFSSEVELKRLLGEVREAPSDIKILLDLEAPLWAPRLLLKNPLAIKGARRLLDELIALTTREHETWTAEYPPALPGPLTRSLRLGLPGASMRIYMLYGTELGGRWGAFLKMRTARRLRQQPGGIAVGVIASGVTGSPVKRSPSELTQDVYEARYLGASVVMVYRLGGLTRDYATALGLDRESVAPRP